ncbi:Hypothetical_protein [Hexamita inflata]|uniref:Hypothetical_protein n=1 Tax=Hexamita inflata TaxID=28002 RepID=A0AA86U9A7_9EUKA|nr:Hypothetical protein HINF_LOCUS33884 [Hexamita inflata]
MPFQLTEYVFAGQIQLIPLTRVPAQPGLNYQTESVSVKLKTHSQIPSIKRASVPLMLQTILLLILVNARSILLFNQERANVNPQTLQWKIKFVHVRNRQCQEARCKMEHVHVHINRFQREISVYANNRALSYLEQIVFVLGIKVEDGYPKAIFGVKTLMKVGAALNVQKLEVNFGVQTTIGVDVRMKVIKQRHEIE